MSNEKRHQERFSLNLQTKVSYSSKDQSQLVDTVAANISPGGAFLSISEDLPLASMVKIVFNLSFDDLKKLKFILSMEALKKLTGGSVWVNATGVVIRKEANGIGIIFSTDYQLTPMEPLSHPEIDD